MAICLRTGIHGIGPSIAVTSTNRDVRPNLSPFAVSAGRSHSTDPASAPGTTTVSAEKGGDGKQAPPRFSFRYPFGSLLPWLNNKQGVAMKGMTLDGPIVAETTKESREGKRGDGEIAKGTAREALEEEDDADGLGDDTRERNGNWVFKILRVKSLWSEEEGKQEADGEEMKENGDFADQRVSSSTWSSASTGKDGEEDGADKYGFCETCQVDDDGDENKIVLDRESFSKLLKKVPLAEAKLYAQLSYLGNLAYDIPNIKPESLMRRHGMRYVTSSIEKRQQMVSSEEKGQINNSEIGEQRASEDEENPPATVEKKEIEEQKNDEGHVVSASSAFQIAASAASFLHSRTRSMFTSSEADASEDRVEQDGCGEKDGEEERRDSKSDMASFVATTDSVTAVVAAKEEVKQAVADDLNSISSSPCDWFICDDDKNGTRFFVIQGSESLASWQANLLFEPTEFEEVGVFVHRGIYEAAKGMYLQMLPEIHAHLKAHGKHAKFRFTGHSLGGSLSLLINLMLLIRDEVSLSSLLPVVTFGSPCIMCGGDVLLHKLGLPRSHIQAVTMHRDIVPRAFSCSYPNHVAELLKAISGNFRNHPCLNKQLKWLYSPMGELIILQPDPKFSPRHDLLPSESGLYLMTCSLSDAKDEAERQLKAAKNLFLNSPHPLEILSSRSAYGSGGTIQRDHDMRSYLKCVRNVIRQEIIRVRRAQRKRKKLFWYFVTPYLLIGGGVIVDRVRVNLGAFDLPRIVRTGGESFKRFSRFVASRLIHLWAALLIPARLLLIGLCSIINIR